MESLSFMELNTPRLLLRRITMEDLPLYFSRIAGNPVVTRYMNWIPHQTIEESKLSIQKAISRYETSQSIRWVITVKPSNALVGIIDLIPMDRDSGICTFAYMLAQEVWGMGYATEALGAVMDFAFSICKARELQADHYRGNEASGRVMEKCGMQYEGTMRQAGKNNQGVCDSVMRAILREDYEA